jgi:hypothetical protein
MIGTAADQVVMLLSPDWFSPYWRTVELRVSPDFQSRLQAECRPQGRQGPFAMPSWMTEIVGAGAR